MSNDCLTGGYIDGPRFCLYPEQAAQHDGVFVEFRSLARLFPPGRTLHSSDTDVRVVVVDPADVLLDDLRLVARRLNDSGGVNLCWHIGISSVIRRTATLNARMSTAAAASPQARSVFAGFARDFLGYSIGLLRQHHSRRVGAPAFHILRRIYVGYRKTEEPRSGCARVRVPGHSHRTRRRRVAVRSIHRKCLYSPPGVRRSEQSLREYSVGEERRDAWTSSPSRAHLRVHAGRELALS